MRRIRTFCIDLGRRRTGRTRSSDTTTGDARTLRQAREQADMLRFDVPRDRQRSSRCRPEPQPADIQARPPAQRIFQRRRRMPGRTLDDPD